MAREVNMADTQELSEHQAHWYKKWRAARDEIEELNVILKEARDEMLDGFDAKTATIDGKPVFTHEGTVSGTKKYFDHSLLEELYPGAKEKATRQVPAPKQVNVV